MVWLFGAVLGAALLYAWLVGNWFARLLVFLLMAVPSVGMYWVFSVDAHKPASDCVVVVIALMAISYMLSSAPHFYRRWKAAEQQDVSLHLDLIN